MKHILVIDDDAAYRRMLKANLEEAGYETLEASDGKQGLRLYQQQPGDLIVVDMYMPEKDGIETILELKALFPDVKIIAISGGGRGAYFGSIGADIVLKSAKEFGADRILYKPLNMQHFLATVDALLQAE